MTESVTELTYSTMLRLKAVPPYDFALKVHKPARWLLLTPHEIFHNGTLWTAKRIASGKMFGLKRALSVYIKSPKIRANPK
jgi:hypothetical protein